MKRRIRTALLLSPLLTLPVTPVTLLFSELRMLPRQLEQAKDKGKRGEYEEAERSAMLMETAMPTHRHGRD